ncbi:MAG: hypothetical protein KAH01_03900 [Caldisericia bacterium]|nr:hypothetical protein [Caldisericia bacterium]
MRDDRKQKNETSNFENSQNITNGNDSIEKKNFLDTFNPKDYYFQIYLTVAVTAIVVLSIFTVGKRTSMSSVESSYNILGGSQFTRTILKQNSNIQRKTYRIESTNGVEFQLTPEIPLVDR